VAKQQVRKKNSNARFVGVLIVIAVVGIGVLGYSMSRPNAAIKPIDPNLPPGTAEGYLIGDPNAPVELAEFGDFECPACGQWSDLTEPDVRERLIKTGLVKFRFFDFPIESHRNTWPAHGAVACAAEQGKFMEMHDQVFALRGEWSMYAGITNPVPGLTKAAKASGVDMAAWQTCFDSQKHYPRIKANALEGIRLGVQFTPTFRIGGKLYSQWGSYDQIKAVVDSLIAAMPKAPATKAAGKSGA
jgi:protein-disulfide isomerase